MFRNVFLSLLIVAVAVTSSSATILNSDGDFGMQTPGSLVTTPWDPVGSNTFAKTDSQSPFTNVYADNGIGANLFDGEYAVGTFEPQTVSTVPALYYNFDIRLNETNPDKNCWQRFALSLNAGAETMFDVYVGSHSLLVSNGYGGYDQVTPNLNPNTWYNLQFAFDLTAMTYTGVIATENTALEISTRTINSASTATGYNAWNGTINSLFTDRGHSPSVPESYDVDNIALSTTPFVPMSTTPTSEALAASTVNIDFNGYYSNDDPSQAVTYAPLNGDVFNGITINSDDSGANETIAESNLLDSKGNATTVGFSASPVGGDVELSMGKGDLINDYLFTHGYGCTTDAAFTIDGLGDVDTVDLIFHTTAPQWLDHMVLTSGAPASTSYFLNKWYYNGVPVVNGAITGTFGDGTPEAEGGTVVVSGISILIPEVEPTKIPGDANNDKKVDGSDVTILAGNWQTLTGASWEMGDFNGDGRVDGSDVTILAGNWQAGVTTAAASVPEPSTVVVLLSVLTVLAFIRRVKQ